jgi:hypothetical protein
MTNARPDFRQEFYRLRLGISRDRRHQDNIAGRNILQRREGASGGGKQALSMGCYCQLQSTKGIPWARLTLCRRQCSRSTATLLPRYFKVRKVRGSKSKSNIRGDVDSWLQVTLDNTSTGRNSLDLPTAHFPRLNGTYPPLPNSAPTSTTPPGCLIRTRSPVFPSRRYPRASHARVYGTRAATPRQSPTVKGTARCSTPIENALITMSVWHHLPEQG